MCLCVEKKGCEYVCVMSSECSYVCLGEALSVLQGVKKEKRDALCKLVKACV